MATIRDFEVHAEEEEDEEGDLGLERTHTLRKHTKVHRGSVLAGSVAGFGENLGDITGMELEYGSSAAPTSAVRVRSLAQFRVRSPQCCGQKLQRMRSPGAASQEPGRGSRSRNTRGCGV